MTPWATPPAGEDASRSAEAVALVSDRGEPCTYEALGRTCTRAREVARRYVEPARPPRILSLLPDEPSSALAVLSLSELATVAPVNPALPKAELGAHASRLRPSAVMVRGDRPTDRAAIDALGLPVLEVVPRPEHCADFDLIPTARPRPGRGEDEAGLILSTSGSTGSPKQVLLTNERMRLSAANIARWLRLDERDRALHMLPLFHVGAFVDLVMAPLSVGGSVHFGHPISTERLVAAIVDGRATWVQLVPTMLHHLLERRDPGLDAAARRLRFVRTVSADLAPSLQKRARARFGDVPIVQMYGMTETAGQITSNPLPPAEVRPGSVGLPAGPEVTVMDAYGNPRGVGETGEVCVAGPTVMSGYLDHDGEGVFHGRWFRTGDLGHLDDGGFLTLTGRRKEMINRGGEKIAPVEIERALLTHPEVVEAAAFGVAHPTLGEEPVAAVVAAGERTLPGEAVVEHASALLADFKRPRRVLVLDALPRLGSGKIDRQGLRRLAGAGPKRPEPASGNGRPDEARGPLERQLARLWARALDGSMPEHDTDFFDAGGDSLAATTFVVKVEQALGLRLPANLLYESPTFGAIVDAIEGLPRDRAPDDPIVRAVRRAVAGWAGSRAGPHELLVGRRTFGTRPPFFFVTPGLAGSEELLDAFHPERPVYAMRTLSKLRSRFGRRLQNEPNKRRLAEVYRAGILAVQPDGPILLGGFCQGADVARLVAEALRDVGREVTLLCVIDRLFTEPVRGRAAVVWTSGSEHSGDTQFEDAERHLALLYPDGVRLRHEPEPHLAALRGDSAARIADFFEVAFADALAREVGERADPAHENGAGARREIGAGAVHENIAGAVHENGTSRRNKAAAALLGDRRRMHAARIRLSAPRFSAPGADLPVRARITNTSSAPWNDSGSDGLLLCARWLNLDGHPRTLRSATEPLMATVEPGDSVTVELTVPFPERRLPMVLMADVVDDGLNWFHRVGSRPGYRLVWPLPVRRSGSDASHR